MTQTTQVDLLPPFSGDGVKCSKCSDQHVRTEFRAVMCIEGPPGFHTLRYPFRSMPEGQEHLHRECSRCGYSWDEALAEPA